MSELAVGRAAPDGGAGAFSTRTVALLLALGVLGFVGMLVMGAFAPDLRTGRGGGHALSDAAIGYSGIVRLAEATGRHPRVLRSEHQFGTEDLVVATPENGVVSLSKIMAARTGRPTLVVLPKWRTEADPDVSGWVRYTGLQWRSSPEGVLAPATRLTVRRHRSGGRPLVTTEPLLHARFLAPTPLQVVTASTPHRIEDDDGETQLVGTLHPLVTDGHGGIVLGQVDDSTTYILADPDLLTNRGMRRPEQASAALAMLDYLNSNEAEGIAFDVTLNGLGHSPSPLRLLFEPPFLAMTLAIAAALALVAWQAAARFGAPAPRTRAIAFGKAALVDNAAALVRKARREAALGRRYADVIRERAAAAFGAPAGLRDEALDAYLDRVGGANRFTTLAGAATRADDRSSLVAAARALHEWKDRH